MLGPKNGTPVLCKLAQLKHTWTSRKYNFPPYPARRQPGAKIRTNQGADIGRACVHMDVAQSDVYAKIHSKNAGDQMEHPGLTLTFNPYCRNPSVWTRPLGNEGRHGGSLTARPSIRTPVESLTRSSYRNFLWAAQKNLHTSANAEDLQSLIARSLKERGPHKIFLPGPVREHVMTHEDFSRAPLRTSLKDLSKIMQTPLTACHYCRWTKYSNRFYPIQPPRPPSSMLT